MKGNAIYSLQFDSQLTERGRLSAISETGAKPVEGERKVFMTGNKAVSWAALAASAEICAVIRSRHRTRSCDY